MHYEMHRKSKNTKNKFKIQRQELNDFKCLSFSFFSTNLSMLQNINIINYKLANPVELYNLI